MKKDLARLREFDASNDIKNNLKKNIVTAPFNKPQDPAISNVPQNAEKSQSPSDPIQPPTTTAEISKPAQKAPPAPVHYQENSAKINKLDEVLQTHAKQEQGAIAQSKKYADESEKQQIFALESQKTGLEKKIETIVKKQEPEILMEKNRILLEQKKWQQKLAPLTDRERKIEAEQKAIEAREKETNITKEKQSLEKERWQLDDKRKEIEKERWTVESELSKLQDGIVGIEENYKNLSGQESSLKSSIAEIDNSLRIIYHGISQREMEKRGKTAIVAPKVQTPQIIERRAAPPIPQKEKSYMKEVPQAIKEKLQASVKVEEERRLRFMEDIEKWAELNKEK
ncbi:MAG: hypothetical protein Q7S10_02715 [bacterium]|nr:hypothetical protein [bacterium]